MVAEIRRAGRSTVERALVASPADAFALFRPLLEDERRERVAAACLDRRGCLLSLDLRAPAGRGVTPLPVAEILRDAMMRGAARLIVAHNHPGGDPAPSREDIHATRRLHRATVAIGLLLLDHVVVARGGACTSFRLIGLL